MLYSKLFARTRKEDPSGEESLNAKLLIRAGFIHKNMAGVYSFLPLGLRVRNKIENIIRKEMNEIGGQEVRLASLQDKNLWSKTGRWDDEKVDNWFKTKLSDGAELGLGFTHEEPLTEIMTNHISSYKDLPVSIFQFQEKFRNELRARSGLLRGREFLMKDLYSFSRDEEEHKNFYESAKSAYHRIFERVGLGEDTYITFASGGSFSEFSHEFQTLSEAGEDTIYLHKEKEIAVNKEVMTDDILEKLNLDRDGLAEKKSIEVGNIFTLGDKFSKPLGLKYKDENGEEQNVFMGSYGIGVGRLMGTVVEKYNDEDGIVWPESVAPYKAHILTIAKSKGAGVHSLAEEIYMHLSGGGVDVFYDDSQRGAGEKLSDADLMGAPFRIVVSDKTKELGQVEFKERDSEEVKLVKPAEVYKLLGI